jgi:hypothetical protein
MEEPSKTTNWSDHQSDLQLFQQKELFHHLEKVFPKTTHDIEYTSSVVQGGSKCGDGQPAAVNGIHLDYLQNDICNPTQMWWGPLVSAFNASRWCSHHGCPQNSFACQSVFERQLVELKCR